MPESVRPAYFCVVEVIFIHVILTKRELTLTFVYGKIKKKNRVSMHIQIQYGIPGIDHVEIHFEATHRIKEHFVVFTV